jgi:hypothetical protein
MRPHIGGVFMHEEQASIRQLFIGLTDQDLEIEDFAFSILVAIPFSTTQVYSAIADILWVEPYGMYRTFARGYPIYAL